MYRLWYARRPHLGSAETWLVYSAAAWIVWKCLGAVSSVTKRADAGWLAGWLWFARSSNALNAILVKTLKPPPHLHFLPVNDDEYLLRHILSQGLSKLICTGCLEGSWHWRTARERFFFWLDGMVHTYNHTKRWVSLDAEHYNNQCLKSKRDKD